MKNEDIVTNRGNHTIDHDFAISDIAVHIKSIFDEYIYHFFKNPEYLIIRIVREVVV